MDGGAAWQPGRTVLQRFVTACTPERRPLYWRNAQGNTLEAGPGGVLSFDTYFNGFYAEPWFRHTALRSLTLEIEIEGRAIVRIKRHALNHVAILHEEIAGPGLVRIAVPCPTVNFRQHGLLTLELAAAGEAFSFQRGAWTTEDVPRHAIGLGVVFCTFNRVEHVGRLLATIGAESAVQRCLTRVFVINQGEPDLAQQPAMAPGVAAIGGKLRIIEQANFGGAGGFTRGLLACLDAPDITHAVLLDDDLEIEPDTLLRMAAFFAFCKRDLVLGGHMLDQLHPTMLYEAGAVIVDRHWTMMPQHFGLNLTETDNLQSLAQPYAVHYNGWWCCGIPLAVLREHGLPLPCFIRGDDLEFGLRLHERGVPTVPMPGMAVWHEPFYLKLGGWQLYYETRNMLAAQAINRGLDRGGLVRRMARQVIVHLLTYRYFSTALVLDGIEDFLAGPAVLDRPPLPLHASVTGLKHHFPQEYSPRERVLAEQPLLPIPNGKYRILALLAWILLRNCRLPTAEEPPGLMPIEQLHWLSVRKSGHIATETWWDGDIPAYRRNREHHRALLRRAVPLIWRLWRNGPAAAIAWREATPRLTSTESWRAYLGIARRQPAEATTEALAET